MARIYVWTTYLYVIRIERARLIKAFQIICNKANRRIMCILSIIFVIFLHFITAHIIMGCVPDSIIRWSQIKQQMRFNNNDNIMRVCAHVIYLFCILLLFRHFFKLFLLTICKHYSTNDIINDIFCIPSSFTTINDMMYEI